jgi:hypothetical protein
MANKETFSQSFKLLYLAGLVLIPGAFLYIAARLGRRRWLATGCCSIAILFSLLLAMLTVVKGGGLGIWAISTLEMMILTTRSSVLAVPQVGLSPNAHAYAGVTALPFVHSWSRPCIPVPPALVNQSLFLSESAWRQVL